MTSLLVGVDIGGSKIGLQAVDADTGTRVVDRATPTGRWRGETYEAKAALLLDHLKSRGLENVAALAVGAHGCDTQQQCRSLEEALQSRVRYPVRVVNDAHLLCHAAGEPEAVGIISGTGSIAVGTTATGEMVFAGGWGWLVGDDGGATGLVREAVRAALIAADAGRPDPLLERLLAGAADVSTLAELSSLMMRQRPEEWALLAPALFAAEAAGSPVARNVIRAASASLAALLQSVLAQGATADVVVLGGSVITAQHRFAHEVQTALLTMHPGVRVQVLHRPPVEGAVTLARGLLTTHIRPQPDTVPS